MCRTLGIVLTVLIGMSLLKRELTCALTWTETPSILWLEAAARFCVGLVGAVARH